MADFIFFEAQYTGYMLSTLHFKIILFAIKNNNVVFAPGDNNF